MDVKVNAVEVLERQLRRTRPGEVFVSSACDGWQPIEAERRLTRQCCQLLVQSGCAVNVLTKSALVLRDLDILSGRNARIGVTVTTLDEGLRALWESRGSSVEERFGGALRRELLDKIVVLNRTQFQRLVREFVTYYHQDRCHLGLEKDAPEPRLVRLRPSPGARVVALPRVGGLRHRYAWREAA